MVFLALVGTSAWGLTELSLPRLPVPARDGPALASVRSWGYQLQRLRASAIPADIDLLVVDYSRSGDDRTQLTAEDVAALRWRPGKPPRIVLAYVSIGEAESYRFYWRTTWSVLKPSWLGPENPEWRSNYAVRYWEPGWQRIILDSRPTAFDRLLQAYFPARKPYVDRLIEAGFDGIYLDRVDAFATWVKERPVAMHDMISFVADIAAYARRRKPGFLVVPQNGEELLEHAEFRRVIDAVAKEDLLFGIEKDGKPNDQDEIARSMELLERARADRLPVLVVEYVDDPATREKARAQLRARNFVPLFAQRQLNAPPVSAGGGS